MWNNECPTQKAGIIVAKWKIEPRLDTNQLNRIITRMNMMSIALYVWVKCNICHTDTVVLIVKCKIKFDNSHISNEWTTQLQERAQAKSNTQNDSSAQAGRRGFEMRESEKFIRIKWHQKTSSTWRHHHWQRHNLKNTITEHKRRAMVGY
mgnify:CR=1 FL=1